MAADSIIIRGARQNNLQGFDVAIPRNRLVAVTGVSGSGKSSLAFDTLFREGQRRFLETLSAYARQFLGRMEKPAVDSVEGLAPAIAVDQKAVPRGARSTVGTLTEIYDHLRVLYARAGIAHCPDHGEPLVSQTPEAVVQQLLEAFDGQSVHVLAPLIRDRKGQHKALFEDLAKRGFVRVRVNGEVHRIEEVPELHRYKRHTVEVVVDRMRIEEGTLARLREAVGQALEQSRGDVIVFDAKREDAHSTLQSCPQCSREAPPLEPRLFSFNSPHGACSSCDGLGVLRRPSEALVVADAKLTIREGALAVTRKSGGALNFPRVDFELLANIGAEVGFDLDTPWKDLTPAARRAILFGTGEKRFEDQSNWNGKRYQGSVTWNRRYRGVIPALERAWKQGGRRKMVEKFLSHGVCEECGGTRLNEVSRSVTVGGTAIRTLLQSAIDDLPANFERLALSNRARQIAEPLLLEIDRRVAFLRHVGLGYLSLDRSADSLSGGEAQRIRLAAQLGAGLQGVMYVLDEPSIGLHPRDHGRLLGALRALRDQGNTVIVVEHDENTLRSADHLIDIGPGAGAHGGRLVAQGPPSEISHTDSPTGRLLAGLLTFPRPEVRREGNGNRLRLTGATGFNLKGVDFEFPLGTLTAVSGVSGSGKSTLVNRTLRRALTRRLGLETPEPEPYEALEGAEAVEDLVVIDAAPIGRTPRSNPATYTGAFGPIRDLFSQMPESRMRGWGPGRFSFNVEGGRCEVCQGAGAQLIELQFLAPVTVPCEECGGKRFNDETLGVQYKHRNVSDVLGLTIEEALEVFGDLPKIARPLRALVDVGVGYLTLGQPSTTLSGGEAQRVKLAKHLQKQGRKHTLYLLDEPTTGLHAQDVARLVGALQRLVDGGHSVLVIEHNLDVLRSADWVIDLGPEGGAEGGELIVAGTPEQVEAHAESYTGEALRAERNLASGPAIAPSVPVAPRECIEVVGATIHNLRSVSVEIPRDALTVITGPSGSGKSSLALDTIYAAGRQRFVESLSTYARQFLSSRDRPPVERLEGLGPAVAVEARTSLGHPRSTVATTTEIHDHLRVLWARAGVRRCPDHGEKLERTGPGQVTRAVLKAFDGEKGYVVAPAFPPGGRRPAKLAEALERLAEGWQAAGFARLLVDGVEHRLDAKLPRITRASQIDLVIDRVAFKAESKSRIAEAVEQADHLAQGHVGVAIQGGERLDFNLRGACSECGFSIESDLEPRHFSFNTHVGACPECDGLGEQWRCAEELLIDNPGQPLVLGASGAPTAISGKVGRYLTKGKGYYEHLLRAVAKAHRIDLAKPFERLTEAHQRLLIDGQGAKESYRVQISKEGANFELEENFSAEWTGLCGAVDGWHARSEDPEWRAILEKVMRRASCRACAGERLAPVPRSVTVSRNRLPELLGASIDGIHEWLAKLKLPAARSKAVAPVVEELRSRLELLRKVGLGYLTLDRSMSTLSGGEARRVRLAASLGSRLVGVCYVLDEPTVGLHPRDIERLTDALLELRDLGNTVIVVEHDEEVMRRADYLIDMGPGAGRYGGTVVASGTPDEVAQVADSLTGKGLRGELTLRAARRAPEGRDRVGVVGGKVHNLKQVDLDVAYGQLTGICGPSGSGKSSLVMECLVPSLRGERPEGRWRSTVPAARGARRVVVVDASPLGRTPASIPATAVGLMDPLRELFARTPEARMRGFTIANFSFNSSKGRCPACEGRGATKVEMQFLADLWLECEECRGKRYRPEVLDVRFRGHSIADLLELPASEALELLEHQPRLARVLATLCDVGLGYIALGQSSTTLSAGEAQRVKLAAELLRADDVERSVVVLDEPSTGLHSSDVQKLVDVLHRLADSGHAVVVIEHHTGLLAACDRLVELGPDGGEDGGRLIADGTPDEIIANRDSSTGPWLTASGAEAPVRGRRRKARSLGATT
ncbi:excinuclease ABC subunit UvrA [Engelhardtia mirabilis]|uniref:UvrABC system protein A n=1 Tax=Engelhardtia mirabilis TaxID=2528011 RepID=A0A518BKS2_9BACT|nr:UvrABC system protein A [Planctomycetes bacterium Pla133]QDV01900.1 UvrABC system protein A [Planctomycetes bacterium Pla86]